MTMAGISPSDAEHCTNLVKEHAPDLYLANLLLPEHARETVMTLHAFHVEATNITLARPEPMAGEIRLQWWREVLEGERLGEASAHPTARALLAAVGGEIIQPRSLLAKLDAHIFDLYNDPITDRTMLEGYLGETRSTLFHNAAQVCTNDADGSFGDAAGHSGVATGITSLLQTLHLHRYYGQVYVPSDLLKSVGLTSAEFLTQPTNAHEHAVMGMVDLAREHFQKAKTALKLVDRRALPAFNHMALVPLYLKQIEKKPDSVFSAQKPILQLRRQWALLRGLTR